MSRISDRIKKRKDIERGLADQRDEIDPNPDHEFVSWYCEPCAIEVYDRRCPICGKLKTEES